MQQRKSHYDMCCVHAHTHIPTCKLRVSKLAVIKRRRKNDIMPLNGCRVSITGKKHGLLPSVFTYYACRPIITYSSSSLSETPKSLNHPTKLPTSPPHCPNSPIYSKKKTPNNNNNDNLLRSSVSGCAILPLESQNTFICTYTFTIFMCLLERHSGLAQSGSDSIGILFSFLREPSWLRQLAASQSVW